MWRPELQRERRLAYLISAGRYKQIATESAELLGVEHPSPLLLRNAALVLRRLRSRRQLAEFRAARSIVKTPAPMG